MSTSDPDADVRRMADSITAMLRARPVFFMDLVRAHRDAPYRTLLLAWGRVRDRHPLSRDDEGHYFLASDAR
jgi:hypothetical protein